MDANVETWASLLEKSPFIAVIIALGIAAVYLFKSRDKLQAKYTEDLVQATSSLQELTAEYLKQSFNNQAAWQDRVQTQEFLLQQQALLLQQQIDATKALESRLASINAEIEKHESRMKEFLRERLPPTGGG